MHARGPATNPTATTDEANRALASSGEPNSGRGLLNDRRHHREADDHPQTDRRRVRACHGDRRREVAPVPYAPSEPEHGGKRKPKAGPRPE
jgi:hypothetical protein